MHLVVLTPVFEADLRRPEDLVLRYRTLPGWAEGVLRAARESGDERARVTVIQRFHHDASFERNGVTYRFLDDGHPADLDWRRCSRDAVARVVETCLESVSQKQPCVVHLNSLGFAAYPPRLRRALPPGVPVVVQHHAERPRRGLAGLLQRRGLSRADGFIFTARRQADDWLDRGVIRRDLPIFEIMEGSTTFTVGDRDEARRLSGLDGAPVFLWVGRLDANKDPLTVLEGIEPVLAELPDGRLHLVFGPGSPLVGTVEAAVASSEVLSRQVRLLGSLPHDRMEAVFASADYLLLGSRYEGSGFALLEALACGVVPIATDIPSFNVMTDGGAVGALWPVGRPRELTRAVRRTLARRRDELSAAARALFERRLSWAAIGARAVRAYTELLRGATS